MAIDPTTPPGSGPPYRVAVEGWHFGGPPCGFTVYLGSVIDSLRRAGFEITLLAPRPVRDDYEEIAGLESVVFGGPRRIPWEQRDLPRHLAGAGYDVYFAGANRGIPLRKAAGTRYVLGLLDLIPLKFFRLYFLKDRGGAFRRSSQFRNEMLATALAIPAADSILTISETSARDIRRLTGRRDVAARLIRLRDVPPPAPAEPVDEFVYIGGEERRKQVGPLLDAFARLVATPDGARCRLVMIGHYQEGRARAAELGLDGRVEWAGWVEHDEKFRRIARSRALVYPSLYEGYGLAIAEGLQAGVPVIAGPGGSQAEIGGDAVRYVDPVDPAAIAGAMREMLDDDARGGWIARGRARTAELTSDRIEREVVDYFRDQAERARASRTARGRSRP